MNRKLFSLIFAALISVSMWATEGALSGRFTINANGDQIVFSQGNLQYKDGTGWRFAEHQWDFIGAWNTSDWVDLFGWGTWGEGQNPLNTSTTDGDYSWSSDFSGTLINATSEGWYTPSTDIFEYILNTRSTNSGIRYVKAKVNDFEGVILLPDNWNSSIYALNNANTYYAWYESTIISLSDWTDKFEANGAVFIPRASMRDGASAGPGGDGHYWTTTPGYAMHITNSDLSSSYGYCYKYYGFSVRLVRAADPEEPYVLQQDEDGNYLLGSVQDWKAFAKLVQTNPTANAKMTADINLGDDQTMVGTDAVPYAGIFDGQGHTLTVNYNIYSVETAVAPFACVNGATILNLHVAGSIRQRRCAAGGVVGSVNGNLTVKKCWVSATLTVDGEGNYQGTIGGIASCCDNSSVQGKSILLEDCLFSGYVATGIHCGGLMSHVHGESYNNSAAFNNCLNIGTCNGPSGSTGTFIRTGVQGDPYTITNCYYKTAWRVAQGAQATETELADGTTTAALQNSREEEIWVQEGEMPMLKIFVSEGSDPVEPCSLEQDEDGYYLLGSVQDWKEFAALVNGGNITANAKMTADIDLGNDQTMVGIESVYYQGTFDGQGYTLTIHYVAEDHVIAPFRFIQQATIKNLRVDGTITTAFHNAAGIVGSCFGQKIHSYIENCVSSVNIISSYVNTNGDFYGGAMHGGIAATLNYYGQLHITDCIFNGSISGENKGVVWGGMLGIPDGTATFYNCLQIGTFDCSNVIVGYNGSGTISTVFGTGYASQVYTYNCHYLNALGNAQGIQATAEQLADGTTTTALNAGRTGDGAVWVQNGSTPMLKIFASTDPGPGTNIEEVGYGSPVTEKVLRNGQLYILRGDKTYTLTGQEVK